MVTAITNSIRVAAISRHEPVSGGPYEGMFLFSYTISITNLGSADVQLKSREWLISDAAGRHRSVSGMGVVGEQPVIHPGESYQYTSACPLDTPFGTMEGYYNFISDQGDFRVLIPRFFLQAPFALN